MSAELTPRQREVAELVARGLSDKAIARELGLSTETVKAHLKHAAERIPGDGRRRYKVMVWFFSLRDGDNAAA